MKNPNGEEQLREHHRGKSFSSITLKLNPLDKAAEERSMRIFERGIDLGKNRHEDRMLLQMNYFISRNFSGIVFDLPGEK